MVLFLIYLKGSSFIFVFVVGICLYRYIKTFQKGLYEMVGLEQISQINDVFVILDNEQQYYKGRE